MVISDSESRPVHKLSFASRLSQPSPVVSRILSVWFGVGGLLYLFAVWLGYRAFLQTNPERPLVGIPAAVVGLAVGAFFLAGAILVWRGQRKGLFWIVAPLLLIAAQWVIGWVTPSLGEVLTFVVSLVALVLSWFELREGRAPRP